MVVDPDATLIELRDAVADCDRHAGLCPEGNDWAEAAARAVQAARALDEWMSARGFPPTGWPR